MKLTRYIVFVDINNDKKIMINSLNGKVDTVNFFAYKTLLKWQKCDKITTTSDAERLLYSTLESRGYLVKSSEDEITIKKSVLDALNQRHFEKKKQSTYMTFIVTYDCNFRCNYCFEGGSHAKKEIISPVLIDAALALAGDGLKGIGLFGGEPLLPNAKPSLEYLVSKRPEASYDITTNGFYLAEYADFLSSINVSGITVTLDGEEEAHNNRRRLADGSPTYKQIINGIQECLDRGIKIRVRMVSDFSNFNECNSLQDKLLSSFSKHNDLLSFEITTNMGLSEKDRNHLISEIYRLDLENTGGKKRPLAAMSPIIHAISSGIPARPVYSYCYAHENNLMVDPYGNLFTCLASIGKNEYSVGKYYPEVEFYENSIFNRNVGNIPECEECKYSLLCGGGCPLRLKDHKNIFKPSCTSIKGQIHDLLPQIYNIRQSTIGSVK